MALIGEFMRTRDGFQGRLRTLGVAADLTIVPVDNPEGNNGPDYRVHLGATTDGPEVGAGWKHVGERAGEFVALQLDCPSFAQPIRANLFQSNQSAQEHVLLWTRSNGRSERG